MIGFKGINPVKAHMIQKNLETSKEHCRLFHNYVGQDNEKGLKIRRDSSVESPLF